MSLWEMFGEWENDLPHLSDSELRDRLHLARLRQADAYRLGPRRSVRARLMWRQKAEQVKAEMDRRTAAK